MNIFKQYRIKYNEMLDDVRSYLSDVYNQKNQVFTPASPFGQIVTVIVGLAQLVFYYIEDSITELSITSASRSSSIRSLVALTGYQPKGSTSAQGNCTITYNGNSLIESNATQVILPNFTRVYCPLNNLYYLIVSNGEIRFSILSPNNVTAKLVQGEISEVEFTGNGRPLQSFRINDKFFDFIDIESIKVSVNSIILKRYESLFDIPLGGLGYIVRNSIGGGIDIFFGSNYNGYIPPAGSTIRVSYIKNSGAIGNLIESENVRFDIVDEGYDNFGNTINLSEYLSVSAPSGIFFGSDPENVELTKIIAPKSSRAYVLSNTDAYEVYLNRKNYFSTVEVFNTFEDDNLLDDNVVYMFLIPNLRLRINPKFNYFTSPINSFLMTENEIDVLLEDIESSGRVMLGTQFDIIQPNVKKFSLHITLDYFKGFSKELIRETIIDAMSDFFINYSRRDKIVKSDLIAILETISGVDSVNVFFDEDPNNSLTGTETYINDMGDIIIGKRDYPLIRGGWISKDNINYLDNLVEGHPCSLNINFSNEVDMTTNRLKTKSVVSRIRESVK